MPANSFMVELQREYNIAIAKNEAEITKNNFNMNY